MSHSVAGEPPSAGRRAAPPTTAGYSAAGYSAAEWELLTGLPCRVLVAAATPATGGPSRGVAAGLAGLDAVAAGRASDSDLVRAVVADIYARDEGSTAPTDRLANRVDLLACCRASVRVLRRADPADSAAYRQWVQSVAARVCRVDPTGLPAPAGVSLAPPDRRFLDRLGGALDLG